MTMPEERLKGKIVDCITRHAHDEDAPWTNSRIAKAVKFDGGHPSAGQVAAVRAEMPAGAAPVRQKRPGKPGLSKKEFLEEFDPYTRALRDINRGLLKLEDERYVKDGEFRKVCGVTDLRMWRDIVIDPDEGFTPYQFSFGEQRWWTTEESVKGMLAENLKAKAVG
jgi:DNA-directed RNA polymerase subunit K/omega